MQIHLPSRARLASACRTPSSVMDEERCWTLSTSCTVQGMFLCLLCSSVSVLNRLNSVQVDIDLPQIAVIGSQSAGKSSLIESISGITLPRAAGTCTRSAQLLCKHMNSFLNHFSNILDAQRRFASPAVIPNGNALSPCGTSPTPQVNPLVRQRTNASDRSYTTSHR